MPAGQRDELELVAHRRQLALERRDRGRVEVVLPVERRRTVVRQQLVRIALVNALGELPCLLEIGTRRLAPDEIRVRRICNAARDRRAHAARYAMVSLAGA